jgi:hypothetical protein
MFLLEYSWTGLQPVNPSAKKILHTAYQVTGQPIKRNLPGIYLGFAKKLFGPFGAVFGPALLSVSHACGVERAADYVVTHARQILYPAAANEYAAVLLKVMTFARYINRAFLLICQPYPGNLSQCRVRLFGGGGRNTQADTALLWAAIEDGGGRFVYYLLPSMPD